MEIVEGPRRAKMGGEYLIGESKRHSDGVWGWVGINNIHYYVGYFLLA
jgi:hypothetical protein